MMTLIALSTAMAMRTHPVAEIDFTSSVITRLPEQSMLQHLEKGWGKFLESGDYFAAGIGQET